MSQSITVQVQGGTVTLADESYYTPDSADNVQTFGREYLLGEDAVSMHSVRFLSSGGEQYSCLLAANAGPTRIHDRAFVLSGGQLYVAVGNRICCLTLPELDLVWHVEADWAACFGIYETKKRDGLIVHGEVSISRLSYSGQLLWQASGRDIFSEGFHLLSDCIEAEDFEHTRYRIDIDSGRCNVID